MHYAKSAVRSWKSVLIVLAACSLPPACSSPTDSGGGGGGSANGGAIATGGTSTTPSSGGMSTGGSTSTTSATGGNTGSGGATGGAGGVPSSGGSSGLGGTGGSRPESGGTTGAGGTPATGGSTRTTSSGGATGRDGGADSGQTGGITGTGGRTGSGGTTGAGGTTTTSSGGTTATGGRSGTGGVTQSGGGPGTGGTVAIGGTTGSGGTSGTGGSGPAVCPSGITQTITVAKDGSGQFSTVQAAVDSIASGSSTHIRIDIKAGTYTEKLTIASRTNLCLVGAAATSTILSYGDANATVGSTSGSASVLISANDFSAANLTIQNTYGSGSQAVALRTTGQRQQFLNCRFVGYQDTLYTHSGSQYFRDCYVQGNVDYVFGGATAVLQNCEVRNVEGGSATTAPNTDGSIAYGIVFLGGKFTAVSSVKSGSVALARPWGAAGFAAYLNADLGAHISAAGFTSMSGNDPANARFHEYGSTGAGANAAGRPSYQLTASQAASYTLSNIFGSWTPSYSQ
jgi:pectin methylesterase-like acyl-CoA thioesterase